MNNAPLLKNQVVEGITGRAICAIGDTLPALDKAQALFTAIQQLTSDATIKKLAQTGIDILSYQFACNDDDLTEIRRLAGVQDD